jgi:hypothetical protein
VGHHLRIARHTVAMTVSKMWKTLEEYGSWIGYRRRVGYSLNISRSDDQIPDRLALVGTKDPRRAREAYCLLPTHGRNRPVRPPRLRSHLPHVFNAGNVWFLRSYVVSSANDPAFWDPSGKHRRNLYQTQACAT